MIKSYFVAVFLCLSSVAGAQQTIVLPAVSNNVQGINGSVWSTELLLIKANPSDQITIRRLWVCLEGGGFADDPESAPTWYMSHTGPGGRVARLDGESLLTGTAASLGAVALMVEGGAVIANARIADISRGTVFSGTPFGQGQLIPTESEPLIGDSYLPWLGGCLGQPCNDPVPMDLDPSPWNFYRNNVGLVNPNPTPLHFSAVVLAFGGGFFLAPGSVFSSPYLKELGELGVGPESFSRDLPPYGWSQFPLISARHYGSTAFGTPILPFESFLVSLTPDSDLPYYAYASVIFSPDPDSDIPAFNDPLFIAAKPGYVAPYDWTAPAP